MNYHETCNEILPWMPLNEVISHKRYIWLCWMVQLLRGDDILSQFSPWLGVFHRKSGWTNTVVQWWLKALIIVAMIMMIKKLPMAKFVWVAKECDFVQWKKMVHYHGTMRWISEAKWGLFHVPTGQLPDCSVHREHLIYLDLIHTRCWPCPPQSNHIPHICLSQGGR